MGTEEVEIELNLEADKPLGFRLAQPSSNNTCFNGITLKIAKVRRKSQAYKQGLKPDDVIVRIDGYSGKLVYDDVMDYLRERQKSTSSSGTTSKSSTMVITVKRGREYGDNNEPVLCISHKPTTAAAATTAAGATHSATATSGTSSPTPASSTNVCCVHGVQSKPSTHAAETAQKHYPAAAAAAATPKNEEKTQQESVGSTLSGLFNFFKKDTSSSADSSAKPAESAAAAGRPKPPAPPPPAPTPQKNGAAVTEKKDDQQQQSWIQRAFQFTESFTTKGKSEEKKSSETKSSSHRSVLSSESVSQSPAPYIIKTTPVPTAPPPPMVVPSTYDSDTNLRYPGAFGSGGSSDAYSSGSSKTTSLFVRTSGTGMSPPSPVHVPEVTIGQSTVQIHVKPRHEYMSSSYTQDTDTGGRSRTAVWTAEPAASSPSSESYYTRSSSQKYTSTATSSTNAADDNVSVQKRRRQWPPPSNASGVEIVKDMWLDGTSGTVADLEASAPESRYESYTSTTTTRDYGGGLTPIPSTGDVAADELAESVTAAALRKSKFGDQLAEQVRMCQNIARALKTPPVVDKPSKAQRMFTSRKNRMEKWVLASSPPPSSIPEEAASSSPSHRTFEPIRNTDTFEVIRSTPQNQQLYVDSSNTYDGSNDMAEYTGNGTVPVEHYKKYSRYSYRSTSSYHSAVDNDSDLHLPKKARNPLGEVHDYQKLTKEYGDKISTNMPSPEKCHELSQTLTSDSQAGKGVEMFHRRRQKAEDWVVDSSKPSRAASKSLPPVAPRRTMANVDPAAVIESVHEAAARKEDTFSPSSRSRTTYTPVSAVDQSQYVSHHHASLNELMDGGSSSLKSPTPPVWGHERLFSPTPFSYSSTPRPFTPMEFGGRRTPLPESHYGDYARPEVTTSVVALSTPSTRIVAQVDPNASGSKINTLPRSWKSFSSAYKQNYS